MELDEEMTDIKRNNLMLLNPGTAALTESEMLGYLEDTLTAINKNEVTMPIPENDIVINMSNASPVNRNFSHIYNFLTNSNAAMPNVPGNSENLSEVADYIQELRNIEEHFIDQQTTPDYATYPDFNQNIEPLSFLNSTDDLVLSPFKQDDNQEAESLEKFIVQNDLANVVDWTQFVNFSFDVNETVQIEVPAAAEENINKQTTDVDINTIQNQLENLRSKLEKNVEVSKYYKEIGNSLNRTNGQPPTYCRKFIKSSKKPSGDSETSTGKYSIFLMPFEKDDNDDDSKADSQAQLNEFVQKIEKNANALDSIVKGIVQSSKKRFIVPFTPKQLKQPKTKTAATLQEQLATIDKENIKIPMIDYNKLTSASHIRKQLFDNVVHIQKYRGDQALSIENDGVEKIVSVSNVGNGKVTRANSKKRASLPHEIVDAKISKAKKARLSLGNLDDTHGQRSSIRIKEKLRNQN